MAIQTVIAEVLKKRHQKVPMLEQAEREWHDLSQQLETLRSMASDPVEGNDMPDEFQDAIANIANQVSSLQQDIDELLPQFKNIAERFRKSTINIGVAGKARQGKSTILQHISGLRDQEIPTSNELPCTGAKSKIYDYEGEPYAQIDFYSADEFLKDIVTWYFKRLKLPALFSLSEFEKPLPSLNLEQSNERMLEQAIYDRLVSIHKAFPTFKHELSTSKRVPLAEIPGYVTQKNSIYMAVKVAHVFTKFPNHDVSGLCLVDLPGNDKPPSDYSRLNILLSKCKNKADVERNVFTVVLNHLEQKLKEIT